jgi:hypothetical protein
MWRNLILLVVLGLLAQAQTMKVSANGRTLEVDGKPFFWLGDTAWQMFHRLTKEETRLYLENRRAKGFTVIQAVVLAELGGLTVPNAEGNLALTGKDPAHPNEDYFKHVDWVLAEARRVGLWIGLLPTWGSYWKPGDARIFDEAKARQFGNWLGRRYRESQVVWILGGDQNIETAEERKIIDAMATGLREGDQGRHLITFHPRGPGRSSEQLAGAAWIDFYMSQSSHGSRDHDNGLYAERDRLLKPPKPTLDGEPRYEGITVGFYFAGNNPAIRFDDADVRQAAWWSVLAGACGHSYGHGSVWQMWQPGRKPVLGANIPWKEALDHPGAFQMGHLRRLMESRSFALLEPDSGRLVIDAPRHGGAKVRAAVSANGSFAIVYSPRGEPFTVDRTPIKGNRLHEAWFDPRLGVAYPVHTGTNGAIQTYTPPTSGRGQDWVLVLDDPAASLPMLPGEFQ